MSELTDCTNSLTARDILRGAARTGPPFYINVLGLGGFCDEYQAVYDVLTTPPLDAIATEQNTMVCGLVEDGVWGKLDWFALFAQTTNAAFEALVNWINPGTNDATLVNNPSFAALEGFTGNGSNNYINSNYNPTIDAINYAQNSASAGVYVRNNILRAEYEMGYNGAADLFIITRFNDNKARIRLNAGSNSEFANSDSRGFFIINRTLSTHQDLYRNKTRIINGAVNSTGIINGDVLFLCTSNGGTPASFSTKQLSLGFLGGGLTQTDIDNFTDRVETYMDSNSKGVIP